jgi:hypothetical protein
MYVEVIWIWVMTTAHMIIIFVDMNAGIFLVYGNVDHKSMQIFGYLKSNIQNQQTILSFKRITMKRCGLRPHVVAKPRSERSSDIVRRADDPRKARTSWLRHDQSCVKLYIYIEVYGN